MQEINKIPRKPDWLKIKINLKDSFRDVADNLKNKGLHTICTDGDCPNKFECWARGTATIMILGNICTRHCKFCNVTPGKPLPADNEEPMKVAQFIKEMELKHCVITSVDRDDLQDFGAAHWAETIRKIKEYNPGITIEALIPDMNGSKEFLDIILESEPNVISHNLETVERLTPKLRSKASYNRSLLVLEHIAKTERIAKSGIMVGVGETFDEVIKTMDDLLSVNCRVMTIGQYLQPSLKHYPVVEYIHPDVFAQYKQLGLEKGFQYIESGPLVRSSYFAEKHINAKLK